MVGVVVRGGYAGGDWMWWLDVGVDNASFIREGQGKNQNQKQNNTTHTHDEPQNDQPLCYDAEDAQTFITRVCVRVRV